MSLSRRKTAPARIIGAGKIWEAAAAAFHSGPTGLDVIDCVRGFEPAHRRIASRMLVLADAD